MMARWDVPAILTTVFMVGTIAYWITRSRPAPLEAPLDETKLWSAALVLAFGLGTSIMPIASTNPPVLGRGQWSALDILSEQYAGRLSLSSVGFDIGATYLLMLSAMLALLLPRPRKSLLVISLLGIICSSWALEMGHSLLFAWFTRLHGTIEPVHVSYGPAMYAIEIIMCVLLLISISD
jgi:hypothetical protein